MLSKDLCGVISRMMFITISLVFFNIAKADTLNEALTADEAGASDESAGVSYFAPQYRPNQPRNYLLSPMTSFILPGFDQWWEGQFSAAATYSSVATLSTIYSRHQIKKLEEYTDTDDYRSLSTTEKENRNEHGELERKVSYSSQVFMATGSLSAYHSFRTAVATRQPYGSFTFLKKEETPWDLLAAPFDFNHLKSMNTIVPLAIISGYTLLALNSNLDQNPDYMRVNFTRSDAFYTGGISFNAGVHEEAFFRGWMMPVVMEWTNSEFWSNTLTAAVFAAAHMTNIDTPIFQLVLGWHLGRVTQKNHWTLSESIFIHTWWDVIALASAFQVKKREPLAKLPIVWVPLAKFYF